MAFWRSYDRQLDRNVFLTWSAQPMPPASSSVRSNSARKALKDLDPCRIWFNFREARSAVSLSSYAARSWLIKPSVVIWLVDWTESTQELVWERASPLNLLWIYQNRTVSVSSALSIASFARACVNQGRNSALFPLNSGSSESLFFFCTANGSRTVSLVAVVVVVVVVSGVDVPPLRCWSLSCCSRVSIRRFCNCICSFCVCINRNSSVAHSGGGATGAACTVCGSIPYEGNSFYRQYEIGDLS
jgi:hypothetical protein